MADLTASTWDEEDNLNNSPPPNGLPTGSKPSELAPTIRDMRGALKRFFNRINAIKVSAGTATAFTLTYDVGPVSYTKGETFAFFSHIDNTGALTLNINGLGARAVVRNDGAALTAAQIKSGNIIIVIYDGTSFRVQSALLNNPTFTGTLTAGAFSGDGSALTNLTATNLTGTIADARLPTTQAGKTFSSWVSLLSTGSNSTFRLADTSTQTYGSLSVNNDRVEVRAGAPGVGWAAGAGHLHFCGLAGANLANLTVRHGGADQPIWHAGNDGAGSTLDADLLDGQHGSHYLNAANLTGTIPTARVSGSYTGITGTGALDAGSITSGFGNINIGTGVFTGNGSGLTSLNASNLASGTVPAARVAGSYTGITGLGTVSATAITLSSGARVSNGMLYFSGASDDYLSYEDSTNQYRFIADGNDGQNDSAIVRAMRFRTRDTADAGNFGFGTSMDQAGWMYSYRNDGTAGYYGRNNAGIVHAFYQGATYRGNISVTGSQVTFNQTSDRRLKEDLQPIDTSALDAIDPYDFRWIEAQTRDHGFIAQDVNGVIPNIAIHDTEEGRDIWTVDYMKMIPLLTAVVKEQRSQINDLLARVDALTV